MILKTGWKGESNFVDPMCGSGTLLIEAAMIALNIAPGVHRKEFAFEKWIDFDQELFDRIYNDESQEREFNFKCYGADINPAAIEIAEKNIRSAGLMKYIELRTQPFQQCTEAPQPGIMVTIPLMENVFPVVICWGCDNMIGERVKHVFTGYKVWILSYKDECFDKIGLKPSEKMKLMNGSLECEYRCYDIFEGKIKDYKKALNEEGEARPSRPERPSFERKPDRSSRPNFRTDRMDRPARRFAPRMLRTTTSGHLLFPANAISAMTVQMAVRLVGILSANVLSRDILRMTRSLAVRKSSVTVRLRNHSKEEEG